MAGDTKITLVGNLTQDPDLRFTTSGVAVTKFTIASTPRVFNRQSNTWEDQETLFLTCQLWRQAAENVVETLKKGTRVIVVGSLKQRSYTNKDGEKRTVFEVEVDNVGPDLTRATAVVTRNPATNGGAGGGGGGFGAPASNAGSEDAPF